MSAGIIPFGRLPFLSSDDSSVPAGWPARPEVDPSTAALIGSLLTREGQMREQGRQAADGVGPAKAAALGLRQGVGMNLDDEVAGLSRASGLPDWTPPIVAAPVGAARMGLDGLGVTSGQASQDYADQRDYARGYHEAAFGAQPVANLAGQFAGSLALPAGAAAQGAGMAGRVGAGMAAGAGYGALSGAGAGEGVEDRALRAGAGATIGGTIGGVVPAVAGALAPAVRAAMPASRPVAAAPSKAADDAIEAVRSGIATHLNEPSFGMPAGKPGPEADAAVEAVRSGIASNLGQPGFGRPVGAPGPDADAAIEAVRAGLGRRFGEPSFGLPPGAPGPDADAAIGALRSGLGRSLTAGGLGLGGAGLVASTAAAQGDQAAPDAAAPQPAIRPFGALAPLFDRAPMGAPQGFSGTSGTIVPQDQPEARPVPAPPARPDDLSAPQSIAPKPLTFGQIPVSASAPVPAAAPSTAPATTGSVTPSPAATAAPDAPSASGSLFGRLGDPRVANVLLGLSQGLLSTKGFGPGIAAGIGAGAKLNKDQAVTDLAQQEFGLKSQKLAKEQQGQNATRTWLKSKGFDDGLADAAMGNPSVLSSVLTQLNKDPTVVQIGGNKYSLKPGEKPTEANLLGPAEADKDQQKLVDVPQPDGTTVKTWLKPGETSGPAVGAPEQSTTANEGAKQAQRRQGVINSGKDPSDPRYADYILSGSLPKETQQLLTASDKKAIMEGEDTILGHKNTLTQLARAMDLSKKAYDGAGAGIRAGIVSNIPEMLGGHTPESLATREFGNVVTGQALDNLKATFGGAPTEGERAILLQVQGSADQPQALREQILKNAMAKVQQKLDFEQQRVDQLRGGTYYKQGGGAAAPAAPAADGAAPAAPVTGAKRLRFDPKTGGFN